MAIIAIPAVEVMGSGKRKRAIPATTRSAPRPYFARARPIRLVDLPVVWSVEVDRFELNKPPDSLSDSFFDDLSRITSHSGPTQNRQGLSHATHSLQPGRRCVAITGLANGINRAWFQENQELRRDQSNQDRAECFGAHGAIPIRNVA